MIKAQITTVLSKGHIWLHLVILPLYTFLEDVAIIFLPYDISFSHSVIPMGVEVMKGQTP